MSLVPRIFVSVPLKKNLSTVQKSLKAGILRRISQAGFEPQEFLVSGLLRTDGWNFERAIAAMKRCDGAVIMGFAQWRAGAPKQPEIMPTVYNHFEGALAIAFDKAAFLIKDEAVSWRGIFYMGGGPVVVDIPRTANRRWLRTPDFTKPFDDWVALVNKRHHVFLGYSGAASATANRIIKYLQSIDVRVRDWQANFKPGSVILDEIEEAAKSCLGGIFLFTADSDLVPKEPGRAAPRDNVVFEAGYFMHAAGRERTLIILEDGVKMPADVGGGIYLPLANRDDTSPIESKLREFIEKQL